MMDRYNQQRQRQYNGNGFVLNNRHHRQAAPNPRYQQPQGGPQRLHHGHYRPTPYEPPYRRVGQQMQSRHASSQRCNPAQSSQGPSSMTGYQRYPLPLPPSHMPLHLLVQQPPPNFNMPPSVSPGPSISPSPNLVSNSGSDNYSISRTTTRPPSPCHQPALPMKPVKRLYNSNAPSKNPHPKQPPKSNEISFSQVYRFLESLKTPINLPTPSQQCDKDTSVQQEIAERNPLKPNVFSMEYSNTKLPEFIQSIHQSSSFMCKTCSLYLSNQKDFDAHSCEISQPTSREWFKDASSWINNGI